jgi:lipopolysaccharide/colanic/teichoic acid biosynthesis glycosyltransferase
MAANATARTNAKWLIEPKGTHCPEIHAQELFLRLLYVEQKRVERSDRRFVLMLAEPSHNATSEVRQEFFKRLIPVISNRIRETDFAGWFENGRVIGTIFTEIETDEVQFVVKTLQARFASHLAAVDEVSPVKLQFHVFPDDWNRTESGQKGLVPQHPDWAKENGNPATTIKRLIDITGSTLALLLGAPLLGAIAIAIKVTSPGPILFRQKRVGQYGREFTFLKFRSMKTANDPSIHEEYIEKFISGTKGSRAGADGKSGIYKLTADPRITPIGHLLRRTSLDELPQFFNVLKGDMSLVGPRPPIPYEVSRYQLWHKRRFLSVRPGLTGLWQVTGRSRTTFDEMVRLDLQYSKSWSVWMDIKILLQTPLAVIKGDGAC